MLRKYYIGLAIVLLLALYVSSQYQSHAQSPAQERAQLTNGSIPEKAQDDHRHENTNDAKWYPPHWYRLFTWPEGVTTWALMLTLLAIAEQTKETSKAATAAQESAKATEESAKATRDSIRLQEIGLQQWVDVVNWKNEAIVDEPGASAKRYRLCIKADLVNQTNFPLTLTKSGIRFNWPGKPNKGWTRYSIREGFFLTPHTPHLIEASVDITEAQYGAFWQSGLAIEIEGQFSHAGVLGKAVTQSLRGFLLCTANGVQFEPDIPMHPQSVTNDFQ